MRRSRSATPEGAPRGSGSPFRALRVRNYRIYFVGSVLSIAGTWTQNVAVAWIVLQETKSSSALGLIVALQFAPLLLLGAWAGSIADRIEPRTVLIVTSASGGVFALMTAVLVSTGHRSVLVLGVMSLLLGCAGAFDITARQVFVSELVPAADIPSAVGMNGATQGGARTIGSALAGVLIAAIGAAACLYVNALSFVAVVLALLMLDPSSFYGGKRTSTGKERVIDGLRYARHAPEIRFPLVAMAFMGTLALNQQVTTPLLARLTFDSGPGLFAMFSIVGAAGATCGAILVASRRESTVRLLGTTSLLLGLLTFVVAGAVHAWLAIVALGVASVFMSMYVSGTSSRLQQVTDPAFRGRVMSIYVVLFLGSTPVGSLLIGGLAQVTNPRVAVAVGAAVSVVVGVIGLARSRRLDPQVVTAPARA